MSIRVYVVRVCEYMCVASVYAYVGCSLSLSIYLSLLNFVVVVIYEYTCVCSTCMWVYEYISSIYEYIISIYEYIISIYEYIISVYEYIISVYEYIGCSLSLSLYLSLSNLVLSVEYEYTCVYSTCIWVHRM